jgi:hypothetical protein
VDYTPSILSRVKKFLGLKGAKPFQKTSYLIKILFIQKYMYSSSDSEVHVTERGEACLLCILLTMLMITL